jgi:hypothetical protein
MLLCVTRNWNAEEREVTTIIQDLWSALENFIKSGTISIQPIPYYREGE